MGAANSNRKDSYDGGEEVSFDSFQILRAIGKGSFGKVCIVQKRDNKKMYAMKYMNKSLCVKKDAVRNVFREVEILMALDHPFIVNLWFTFQDEEDMFMVVDLLLGGDLRYHIQQEVHFEEGHLKLYMCEIALALDYLQRHHIIHRDIKPDNILLDEEGHVHITDFNIATVLVDGQLATSMSGTTPYIAPEVFACALDECPGYSFPVDWWSFGVCIYEMLRGRRPYEIHSSTSILEVKQMFTSLKVHYSSIWPERLKDLVKQLLYLDPDRRISTLEAFKKHIFVADVDFDRVLAKDIKPSFVPSKDHLNCDPTYELEEMIIEAKPLHKKKKRLAKQNSKRGESQNSSVENDGQDGEENIYKYFQVYNRERDLPEFKRKLLAQSKERQGVNESFEVNDNDETEIETINPDRKLNVKPVTRRRSAADAARRTSTDVKLVSCRSHSITAEMQADILNVEEEIEYWQKQLEYQQKESQKESKQEVVDSQKKSKQDATDSQKKSKQDVADSQKKLERQSSESYTTKTETEYQRRDSKQEKTGTRKDSVVKQVTFQRQFSMVRQDSIDESSSKSNFQSVDVKHQS